MSNSRRREVSSKQAPEVVGHFTMMEYESDHLVNALQANTVIIQYTEWYYQNVAIPEYDSEPFVQSIAERAATNLEQATDTTVFQRLRQAVELLAVTTILRQAIEKVEPRNTKEQREKKYYISLLQKFDGYKEDLVRLAQNDVLLFWLPGEHKQKIDLIRMLQNASDSLSEIYESSLQNGW